MSELFPTPQAAVEAMCAAGWQVRPAYDLLNESTGCTAALQGVQLDDGDVACTPRLVTVDVDSDGRYTLTGRISGEHVEGWAVAAGSDPDNPLPLLLWVNAEPEVLDPSDPRNRDRRHDGMPADPFGDSPAHAQLATDGIELKAMLDTYVGAGFTRAEAFELVLAIHQTELDHRAQHCLVQHQINGGLHDDEGGES